MVENLKKGRDVDWTDYKIKELENLCHFYIEIGVCKKTPLQDEQYQLFLNSVNMVNANKEKMISDIVNIADGLKQYLQIHSVFKIDSCEHDWFSLTMMKALKASDADVNKAFSEQKVPEDILDKIKIFDPEPIGLEVDPIRIEYDFWDRDGPIKVIDLDWELVVGNIVDVEHFVSQYQPIRAGPMVSWVPPDDSDLPF